MYIQISASRDGLPGQVYPALLHVRHLQVPPAAAPRVEDPHLKIDEIQYHYRDRLSKHGIHMLLIIGMLILCR